MFDSIPDGAAGDQDPVSSPGVPEDAQPDLLAPPAHESKASDRPPEDSPGGCEEEPSALAALVATLPDLVGLDLARAITPVPVAGQDAADLLEISAAWSRVASWATARRAEALAEIVDDADGWSGTWADGFAALATEVAMRECISRQSASSAVRTAVMLAGPLQATAEALHDGAIDPTKAGMIARTLQDLPFDHVVAVEDEILPEAGSRTPTQLGRSLSRAVIAVDPQGAEENTRAAAARRRVCHPKALPDGMASIYAVLPAGDAIALDLALDGAARGAKSGGDPRTMDQLRADVLASIGADALRTGSIGNRLAATSCSPRAAGGHPQPALPVLQPSDGSPTEADDVPPPGMPPAPVPPAVVPPPGVDLSEPDWHLTIPQLSEAHGAQPPDWHGTEPPDWHGTEPPDWEDTEPPGWQDTEPPDWEDTEPPGWLDHAPETPTATAVPEADQRHQHSPFELGRKRGVPVRVHVTVPLSTLLGGDEAAELDGYGPIDPATARALARGGTWRRIVTDPLTGMVLDVGRTRYPAPADLDELIRLRDGTCFRPGCSTAATACELDHTRPWSQLGTTSWANLGAGCTADHGLKTNGDFRVRQHRPGVFTWTSRLTGASYRRELDGRTTVLGPTRTDRRRLPRDAADLS